MATKTAKTAKTAKPTKKFKDKKWKKDKKFHKDEKLKPMKLKKWRKAKAIAKHPAAKLKQVKDHYCGIRGAQKKHRAAIDYLSALLSELAGLRPPTRIEYNGAYVRVKPKQGKSFYTCRLHSFDFITPVAHRRVCGETFERSNVPTSLVVLGAEEVLNTYDSIADEAFDDRQEAIEWLRYVWTLPNPVEFVKLAARLTAINEAHPTVYCPDMSLNKILSTPLNPPHGDSIKDVLERVISAASQYPVTGNLIEIFSDNWLDPKTKLPYVGPVKPLPSINKPEKFPLENGECISLFVDEDEVPNGNITRAKGKDILETRCVGDDNYKAWSQLFTDEHVIPATITSDDEEYEAEFDAELWFEQAEDNSIMALASAGWKSNDDDDLAAHFLADKGQPDVQIVLGHCEETSDASQAFVVIEPCKALEWLKKYRLELYNELLDKQGGRLLLDQLPDVPLFNCLVIYRVKGAGVGPDLYATKAYDGGSGDRTTALVCEAERFTQQWAEEYLKLHPTIPGDQYMPAIISVRSTLTVEQK